MAGYPPAVEDAFGSNIDYAIIEKMYQDQKPGRYSPGELVGTTITHGTAGTESHLHVLR